MKKSNVTGVAIGAGLVTLTAVAAGVYMLTGKHAKNRKKLAKWGKNMQEDILAELSKAGKHSKASYNKIVDQVSRNYKTIKQASAPEVMELAKELKGHWDIISKEFTAASKQVKKVVPKAVRSVAKKVSVKTIKKAVKKTTKK